MNLTLGAGVLEEIIKYAQECYPMEACGLVAGPPGGAGRFIPMQNIADSQTTYEMDPGELIHVLRGLRDTGETLFAICHSHPRGPASPSGRDIERAYYPEAAHLIVSLAEPERPRAAAFRIIGEQVMEVELHAIV